jgi:benzoyl-CoA reductase/2-hydroxyglutaryl-CoA dehydratase subunit BcrC/BadD/HgdB
MDTLQEGIIMDEKILRKLAGLNESKLDEATANADAIANDLADFIKLAKGNPSSLKRTVLKVIRDMDTRERAAVAVFVANMTDELDPDVPTPD